MTFESWTEGHVGARCPRDASYGGERWPAYDVQANFDPPVLAYDPVETPPGARNAKYPHFMSLPLEIRLEIYHWLHLMNPIRQRAPSPGYPAPDIERCVQRPVLDNDDQRDRACDGIRDLDDAWIDARETEKPKLLCPNRPLCGLPSGLLGTSRQVYDEARLIPFHTNEFVFVTWFTSGLQTASAIVNGVLAQWQREAMRYVRIEMTERDLQEEAPRRAWTALSKAWTGLQGLRIKISGVGVGSDVGPNGGLGVAEAWVLSGGLAEVKALERLEVELDVPTWDNGRKLAWCDELERCLQEKGSRSRVVCTEKTRDEGDGKGQMAG